MLTAGLPELCGVTTMDGYQLDRQNTGSPRLMVGLVGLVLVATVFAAGFVVGSSLTASGVVGSLVPVPVLPASEAPASAAASEEVSLDVFWEVWNTLESRFYYDLPSEEERVQGAIYGLIESLDDPYTAYVPPDVARILNEDSSGSFEGIGAFVEEAPEGGVYIIRVFDDGPAQVAGLRSGDVVVAVDGEDVTRKILREALLLIRGPAGTEVTLTVVREGEPQPFDLTMRRARLDVPTVEARMLDNDIGYVALFDFNARASSRLRDAVRGLINDGAESLILDLRDNPGGYLDESIRVADLFLGPETVLIQRDVDGNERRFTSRGGDLAEGIPLVVLVNQNSASASEIVAAALQDSGRATLIGQTTFGKGSVQLQYNLTDGSLLRVTYANWYTPDDRSISENGVTPDIVVAPPTVQTDRDLQLERAIRYLTIGR